MNSSRRIWLFGGVAAAAVAAGAWWRLGGAGGAGAGGEALDNAFWAQDFDRPDGGQLALASLRGKPTIVNFWATWCPPCVDELPLLDRFFRENASNGWQVVGLAIDKPDAVRQFLGRIPLSFPIGMAGFQGIDWVKRLGNTDGGLPFSLLLDASGRLEARKMGQLTTDDLQKWRQTVSAR
jgi:thiol-disulfide isomerase/thioredoxin